jgi:hypothetical protein
MSTVLPPSVPLRIEYDLILGQRNTANGQRPIRGHI